MPEQIYYQGAVLIGKKDDEYKQLKSDVSSELIVISHEHSKIHNGELYSAGYYNTSVANDASIELLLQLGDKTAHTQITVSSGGDAEFYVYEGTTFSGAGTTVTPVNHNRSSSNTATTTVTHTPTLTADGTLLWAQYIVGGSGPVSPGTQMISGDDQVVYAKNTDYLMRLTNRGGANQPLQVVFTFYEI